MRPPDLKVGPANDPYMLRWFVIPRNKWFNIYLHRFLHSDDDRALHDHPWAFNVSIMLRGHYVEVTPGDPDDVFALPLVRRVRRQGSINVRLGPSPHRVELIDRAPVWTLFLTGWVVREWGFYCPQGWKHWMKFTRHGNKGEMGPGCDE